MTKIAVYSLTRDRLDYTIHCFSKLREKSGHEFDHYIVDNGSDDGTRLWLKQYNYYFKDTIYNPFNMGISVASNQALEMIFTAPVEYDLVIKFDNDCEVFSDNILAKIAGIYRVAPGPLLLSPRVVGIKSQPVREFEITIGGYKIGRTGIVGGLFHILNASSYSQYRYPTNLPKAKGQDDDFCDWAYKREIPIGYVEDLIVNHIDGTDGQFHKYPEYFYRKWVEEKEKIIG